MFYLLVCQIQFLGYMRLNTLAVLRSIVKSTSMSFPEIIENTILHLALLFHGNVSGGTELSNGGGLVLSSLLQEELVSFLHRVGIKPHMLHLTLEARDLGFKLCTNVVDLVVGGFDIGL